MFATLFFVMIVITEFFLAGLGKTDKKLGLVVISLTPVMLGENFNVLTNEEQHEDLYRIIKLEKLFTFLALSLLIAVGSINIFFSLMMLAIDKKKDISILMAMGASQNLIRKVFISEGALIAFIGAGIGLLIGGSLCWLQDNVGLVGMGMSSGIVANYPVKMEAFDFISTAFVIVFITVIVSIYPAKKAAKSFSAQQL